MAIFFYFVRFAWKFMQFMHFSKVLKKKRSKFAGKVDIVELKQLT